MNALSLLLMLLATAFLSLSVLAKPVVRSDPREGILEATHVLLLRPLEEDTFRAEEVFLGAAPLAALVNLPGFKLTTQQMYGPDIVTPMTPDTRLLVFLRQTHSGWEITQHQRCFFWVPHPSQAVELRGKAQAAVLLREAWEQARATTDPRERVERLWPFLWGHGVSFQQHTQGEMQKTGTIAGDFIAERLTSLSHSERMTLLPGLSAYGGARLHAALRIHLREQQSHYERSVAAYGPLSLTDVQTWNRLPEEMKNIHGELYYALAGLAGFKDRSDLPLVREVGEWSSERGLSQVCEAALQAFQSMPEEANLPVIRAIWEKVGIHPPDGNGVSVRDITRTLRTHRYPEAVPSLAVFLGDENTASEARAFLVEIVGQDLGPRSQEWIAWFERQKNQKEK